VKGCGLIMGAIASVAIWLFSTAAVALPLNDLTPLTLEVLQERLESPVQQDGKETLDFSKLLIDLTSDNIALRDRFYTQIQAKINRAQTPLSLDFSQSTILGDFKVAAWGTKVQLIEAVLTSLIAPEDLGKLQQKLALPTLPQSGRTGQNIPYTTILRGALKLNETEFQGRVDFSNTLFLQPFEAQKVAIADESHWQRSIWLKKADFAAANFAKLVNFENAHFLAETYFEDARFRGIVDFQYSRFEGISNWARSQFFDVANWLGTSWQEKANFSQTIWHNRALFSRSVFASSLDFWEATFEKAVAFRETRFHEVLNFKDVHLLEQVDLSNAWFQSSAYFNIDGLAFDSNEAKILGDKGKIGSAIQVPSLPGNETVLLNLVRNFRRLEQIADANKIEYLRSRLHARQLENNLRQTPWYRWLQWQFSRELLLWLGLSVLLLLSDYGTNFSLVLMVGIWASAYFGLLFWTIDRSRLHLSQFSLPSEAETIWMGSSFGLITLITFTAIFRVAASPWLTLACLSVVLLPIPILLAILLYWNIESDDDLTYFMEDGSMRQLRLLIVRLPIMPRFSFFRDRYAPILRDRRWGWLNYYDFSLNNLLKFGFNDIRLRDRHLPGFVSALAWYQWGLGLLYVALLLWTLSRSIPGLNLLLYLS
jgi:hypothetical protein